MELGIKGQAEWIVTEDKLAKNVGSGEVAVFATPMLLAGIEYTAMESVKPYLPEGKVTVGVHADFSHLAATPTGMKVRFETELTAIDGKMLTFQVAAFDEVGKISEGIHQRAIVTKASFEERAKNKGQK
jgi:fluoroacetyl-CoA thioesterase